MKSLVGLNPICFTYLYSSAANKPRQSNLPDVQHRRGPCQRRRNGIENPRKNPEIRILCLRIERQQHGNRELRDRGFCIFVNLKQTQDYESNLFK
jgi:hypothetical protein